MLGALILPREIVNFPGCALLPTTNAVMDAAVLVLVVTEMMNVELEAALFGAPADAAVGMAEN